MAKAMNIRGLDEQVMRDFSSGAHLRGITQAEYLARLIELRRFVDNRIADTLDEELEPLPEKSAEAINDIFVFLIGKGLTSRSV